MKGSSVDKKIPGSTMFALLLSLVFVISVDIFVQGQNVEFENEPINNVHFGRNFHEKFQVQAEKEAANEKIFRLTNDVIPVHYNLKVVPNLFGNFSYSGQVVITLQLRTTTKQITLHSFNLVISSVHVSQNMKKLDSNYTLSSNDQLLIIQIQQKMFRSKNVTLNITFLGYLNDDMIGFYRSSYQVGNSTKWLAITKFEPTYARWAFPCFDEPKFRATFNISVARYPHQKAISNMPLLTSSNASESINNLIWDTFQMTPPMPTYLVAFAVCELNYRTNAAGVVKVWARENAMNDTEYGLRQAVIGLRQMEAFVSIPYILPKLDVVAIPDFKAGAMENWGLTTYRERLSLFNSKLGNERNKELVTSVIIHEFSHQWFGDLVTLAWWDFVWLNEGFATYFEYFLTAIVEPTWRYDEIFVVEVLQTALSYDGISIHTPMTSVVSSLSAINAKFDVISYEKAGSVIRMIEHIVSTNTFKKALNLYLNTVRKDAGGVAEPSHLYEAFDEEMDKEGKSLPHDLSISTIFKKFSDQPGYPCILISRQSNMDRASITIKQVPYTSPRSSQNITQKTWIVPLSCTKQSQPDFANLQPKMWLVDEKEIVLQKEVRNDEWYICNLRQSGYYRVNYDEKSWQLLIEQLKSSHLKIHQLNRAQLINDACIFARDNFLPYSTMFDLMSYLEKETDPLPWYRGLMEMQHFIYRYTDSKAYKEIQHFAKHIIGHFYKHIGFYERAEDSHLVKVVRSQLIFIACDLDIEDAATKAQLEFSSRTDLSEIPAYMKEAVLCVAIKKHSNMSTWNKLWQLYATSNYQYEKTTIISIMSCATNETLLKKFISKPIDKDDHDIRKQDEPYFFRSMNRYSRGVTATINFIHDTLPRAENCTKTHIYIMRLLQNIMGNVQSSEQIHRLDHVIEEAGKLDQQKIGDIKETLIQVKVSAIKMKARIDEAAEKIFAALTSRTPTSTPTPTTPKPSSASNLIPYACTFTIILLLKWL